jgi:phospholipid transport system substrate-binding protein
MSKLIVTTLSLFVLAAPARAADSGSDKKAVAAVIRTAVDKVLTTLKNQKLSRADKRKRVAAITDPIIDFRLMAMLSLGRKRWSKLEPGQRKSFTGLFIQTLRESYFEKIDLFTEETVEFVEPVANGTKFYVLTYILSKGERIKVAYRLYRKKGSWTVFDFEIEGVSVVKSYGSQYADFLREGSFEQLLVRMREKIEAVGKKDSSPGKEPESTGNKEKAS